MIIKQPTAEHIPALRSLWQQAFGDSDAFLDGFFATAFSFDRCRCLISQGQLAAALYWFDCSRQNKKVAYLYAVATDPALRGKGLCRALMADTHRHLQALGYAGAALVPGNENLFGLYEKFGYRSFCPMSAFSVAGFGEPVKLDPLTPEAYSVARRGRLGKEAIVQDRNFLRFFNTFGQFFQAEGAIFAVSKDDGALAFQEYLGDPTLLHRIINTLGAESASVRISGGKKDSAMYLPLDNDPTLPDYFGIPMN